jgi:HlyD family secretion protein
VTVTTGGATVTTRSERRRRARRRTRRGWLLIVALLLAASAVWFVWLRPTPTTVEADTGPVTATLFPQTYRETVSGTGTLQAARSLDLAFGVAGTVTELPGVGDRIVAGEVLARLDPTPFERSVRDAEFALEQANTRLQSTASGQSDSQMTLVESIRNAEVAVADAERERERAAEDLALVQRLFAAGSESAESVQTAQDAAARAAEALAREQLNLATLRESQGLRLSGDSQDLRNAELSVEAAQLALERSQEDLVDSVLLAPFDGVVASLSVDVGNGVASSAAVLTLIDDRRVELEAQIDETEVGLLSLGLGAEVVLDALPERSFVGEITTIAPVARSVSGIPVFDVTITLDNADLAMRPGMTAEAEVLVREVEGTASVPSRALQSVRGRTYLQLIGEGGGTDLLLVEPVATSGLNTVIRGDFAAGAEVLVAEAAPEPVADEQGGGGFRLPLLGGGGRR